MAADSLKKRPTPKIAVALDRIRDAFHGRIIITRHSCLTLARPLPKRWGLKADGLNGGRRQVAANSAEVQEEGDFISFKIKAASRLLAAGEVNSNMSVGKASVPSA